MKSLNTFINEFEAGFQYNNRFACRIQLPNILKDNERTSAERVAIEWLERGVLCESTNLPDRSFEETAMTQYGLTEQFPIQSEYTTLDCTFNTPLVVTELSRPGPDQPGRTDNPVPRIFHAWQNLIQNMSFGYDSPRDFTFSGNGPTDGYYGEIELAVFDRQNSATLLYSFERVYPRVVQSTPVTWREENELTKLTVGFTFSVWRPVPADDPKAQAGWFARPEFLSQMREPFNEFGFRPPRRTIGGILTDIASDIIGDVTNGRVRIG